MKKIILFLFVACAPFKNPIKVVDKKAYMNLIAKEYQIIDVRTPSEFKKGHIENAINVDFKAANFIENISFFDKNKTLLIYCRTGNRSGKASKLIDSIGFSKIYDLKGGFMNW